MHRETATYKESLLKNQAKMAPSSCTKTDLSYGGKGPAVVAEFAFFYARCEPRVGNVIRIGMFKGASRYLIWWPGFSAGAGPP
jgi:hypothetical protein